MAVCKLAFISFALNVLTLTGAKVYDRCELARELREVHEIPDTQIPVWVCLARHESEYNTSAVNPGSGDHGLFQISQLFWCSPPGYACGVSCSSLRDDDIEDDVICARRVYREHRRLSGDGFNAWVVYNLYCKDKTYLKKLMEGCFSDSLKFTEDKEDDQETLPPIDYFPQFSKVKDKEISKINQVLSTYQPKDRLFGKGQNEFTTERTFYYDTHSKSRPAVAYTTKPILYSDTSKPVTHTPEPASYTPKPVTYTDKPVTYTDKPVTYTVKPVTYTAKHVTYTAKPVTYTAKPVTYTAKPVTYTAKPVTYTAIPVAYRAKPVTYTRKPISYSYTTKPVYTTERNAYSSKPISYTTYTPKPTSYYYTVKSSFVTQTNSYQRQTNKDFNVNTKIFSTTETPFKSKTSTSHLSNVYNLNKRDSSNNRNTQTDTYYNVKSTDKTIAMNGKTPAYTYTINRTGFQIRKN